MSVTATEAGVGMILRDWRQRRRLSQLDLALEAGVSTKHLSFVETGRSKPSQEMVLHLAEQLQVPLRERNQLLLAAGYAPRYSARSLDEPEMWPVRDALGHVLAGHEPYPALAVDTGWNLVASNGALGVLLEGVAPELLAPPVNCMRLALHPEGLAPRIINLGEWHAHLIHRLERQLALTGDERVAALQAEVLSYPGPAESDAASDNGAPATGDVMVGLRIATEEHGDLSFFSTVTTFGTAVDITVSELSIEAFFPADAHTAAALNAVAAAAP
jgi:transcriptional regulator with XRE-family HTH domain